MMRLDRLINVLGGYGARLCAAPRGREVALRGVALHDPAGVDEVLLAVGVDDVAALVADTLAAVVLLREVDEATLAVARERGVAVVRIDPGVSWGQLAAVVYGLVLEGRETEAGRGPTDLFALADALAASVGGPVTIEDQHAGVLAYSSRQEAADRARLATILGRRVPPEIRAELTTRGVYAHLASSDEPIFAEPMPEFHGRAVIAIRAGRELLGSIWVEVPEPLDSESSAALRAGARTASLHLLRARASADLERQVESDLVIGLLEGQADAPAVLSRLGLRGEVFRVIAVQAEQAQDAAVLLAFERATAGFGWARPGRSALFANTVYTVLPESEPPERWFRALRRNVPGDVRLRAGTGGEASSSELPLSRQEADESLAVGEGRALVDYEQVWHEILLRRLRGAAASGRIPSRGPVWELRRHDAEHGTRYTTTLREWLRCQGDPGAAAHRLGVHANTVRYRMRKMAEVTRLDLDDPDERLALIVALLID
ncbi:PucR family transcriptional regulator [Saccharopolyspora sp. MS10]|uniref:PucR family transcriptional regulator n=1 Tax=Saccharopolyspora sp. MS10 TaxID=3385973 RepID=UPI0039A3736A